MAKKRLTLHDLFYNNKFVFVFSVVCAFFLWVAISMTVGTEVTETIKNVPVTIEVSNSVEQLNLQTFDTKTYYVDVEVKGKRYVVGSLTPKDISVVAKTDYVSSVGKHTLNLVATPVENNYEILSLSQNYIEMYFDVYKEATFTLKTEIVSDQLVPEGYISEAPVLSTNSVLITGPATEVNKIDSVVAKVVFDEPLTASTTVAAEIIPQNEYGGTMSYLTINGGKEVTLTIPVKKIKTLPVTVDFYDMPSGYLLNNPLDITVSPATVEIAAEASYVDSLTKISVGTVNFHDVAATRNKFTFDAKLSDVTICDGTESFTVYINARSMSSASFTVDKANITLNNVPQDYDVTVAQEQISDVKIIGPSSSVSALSSQSIFADIDLSSYDLKAGSNTVEVKIRIKDNTDSWAYGQYTVKLNAVKK